MLCVVHTCTAEFTWITCSFIAFTYGVCRRVVAQFDVDDNDMSRRQTLSAERLVLLIAAVWIV